MSRNDVTDVSSQKPYSTSRSSAITSPVIAPANSTSSPMRRVGRLVEVARRVPEDEHADAGDEDEHQRGEAVDPEVELDAEGRDPVDRLVDAGGDVVPASDQPHERGDGGHAATT